jgi:O-succinylbenzoate synthase
MLETGIGRAHCLHLASLANFSLPADIVVAGGHYDPDIVEPPIAVRRDGTVPVPTAPGIGVTVVEERVTRSTEEALRLHA